MFKPTGKSTPRPTRKLSQALAALAVSALTLTALPAGAQGTSGSGTGGTTGGAGSASGAAGVTSSGSPRAAGDTASGAMVSRDDSTMMANLAQANMAEIETGKMALEKTQNPQVRQFAQQMIDDHTSALQELRTLAQAKGVALPDGTDMQHKAMAAALKMMTGATFDNQYMKRAGVNDHQRTIELLQTAQKSAQDPEFKAMAAKMLPTVERHLEMAQKVVSVTDKK